jgi:hypothetical protein
LAGRRLRDGWPVYRQWAQWVWSGQVEQVIEALKIRQQECRVKGTEKFWSGRGAEALLQLAADYLSETKPLTTFWRERPSRASGQRCYQAAT